MKINLLKIACILALGGVFTGFYAYAEVDSEADSDKIESPYDRMGRLHNEGLDYVLEKIIATAPLTKSGGRVIPALEEIQRMCEDFARSKGYGKETGNTEAGGRTLGDFLFLSDLQQKWLGKMRKMVWKVTPNGVEEFVVAMKALERQLRENKEMGEEEKDILYYVMSVCCYSARYWAANHEKWQIELYGMDKVITHSVKSDIENTKGEYVSLEWWEAYRSIVWADGVNGIRVGGKYYLADATAASVQAYLH